MCGVMVECRLQCVDGMCGYADNNIGDIGAQYIGDGLKSLVSLQELVLNGEWCVPHCLLCMRLNACVLDVQSTRLETLEHNTLVIVSSHLHLLQH